MFRAHRVSSSQRSFRFAGREHAGFVRSLRVSRCGTWTRIHASIWRFRSRRPVVQTAAHWHQVRARARDGAVSGSHSCEEG